jgi:tetratricopeptide (TPR) repeat protein
MIDAMLGEGDQSPNADRIGGVVRLGNGALDAGQYSQAEQIFARAITHEPHPDFIIGHTNALIGINEKPGIVQGIGELLRASDATQDTAVRSRIEVTMGQAYGRIGQYGDALVSYLNAYDDDPTSPEVAFLDRARTDPDALFQELHDAAEQETDDHKRRLLQDRIVIAALAARSPLDEPEEEQQ